MSTVRNEKSRNELSREQGESRPLTNPEKVAVLLLAMDKPLAERVLQYFDDKELSIIARNGSRLGAISRSTLENLISEFEQILSRSSGLEGTVACVEQLLQNAFSKDRCDEILADLRGGSNEGGWSRLSNVPEAKLTQYLISQHPQIAAAVLSKATPNCSAAVITQIPTSQRHEITRRMLSIKQISDHALDMLQSALGADLLTQSTNHAAPDIHSKMANIINKLDRQRMDEILSDLSRQKPKDMKKIRGLLFSFEDIIKLSPESCSKLFDQVPQDLLITALKGADAALVSAVLVSTGARARRMIEQEIAAGGAVPPKEIYKARRAIADLALDLAQRGQIDIARDAASEEE